MNDLEMLLKNHAWDLSGYVTRTDLDQAMRTHAGPEAQALWEKYCPWSEANGGYINWSKNARSN